MEVNDAIEPANAAAQYELFDRVRTHLLRQAAPARDALYHCRYRYIREDGTVLMCAVGCLIPDGVYRPEIEGPSVMGLTAFDGRWEPTARTEDEVDSKVSLLAEVLNLSGVPAYKGVRELLFSLQRIHDCFYPHVWKQKLLELERSLPL